MYDSVHPKVSIRVDRATELGTKVSQSEAAAANVRVMPELKSDADWLRQRLNSVATLTRIEKFSSLPSSPHPPSQVELKYSMKITHQLIVDKS